MKLTSRSVSIGLILAFVPGIVLLILKYFALFQSYPPNIIGALAAYGPRISSSSGWWRLLTTSFVHASLIAALISVLVMFQLGRMWSISRGGYFLLTYFVSAVFASAATIYFHPLSGSLGANSAAFGLFGFWIGKNVGRLDIRSLYEDKLSVGAFILLLITLFLPEEWVGPGASGGAALGSCVGILLSLAYNTRKKYWFALPVLSATFIVASVVMIYGKPVEPDLAKIALILKQSDSLIQQLSKDLKNRPVPKTLLEHQTHKQLIEHLASQYADSRETMARLTHTHDVILRNIANSNIQKLDLSLMKLRLFAISSGQDAEMLEWDNLVTQKKMLPSARADQVARKILPKYHETLTSFARALQQAGQIDPDLNAFTERENSLANFVVAFNKLGLDRELQILTAQYFKITSQNILVESKSFKAHAFLTNDFQKKLSAAQARHQDLAKYFPPKNVKFESELLAYEGTLLFLKADNQETLAKARFAKALALMKKRTFKLAMAASFIEVNVRPIYALDAGSRAPASILKASAIMPLELQWIKYQQARLASLNDITRSLKAGDLASLDQTINRWTSLENGDFSRSMHSEITEIKNRIDKNKISNL